MARVILAHGLWMPGAVMQPLAARLARRGFECRIFSYGGAMRPLAAHVERLARFARDVGPAHYVGHSLGGLVAMETLNAHPELPLGRAVMLGTPARGCRAARRLVGWPGGRWMLGESEVLWREGRTAAWRRPEALGLVAGSLPLGLGRLFGSLPGINDGVVTLEETDVEGAAGRVVLPVGHSAMLVSARVAECVAAFLEQGHFDAPRG